MKKGDKTVFEGVMGYEKSNQTLPFHLDEPNKVDRKSVYKKLSYFLGNNLTSTRKTHITNYIEINAKMLQLLHDEFGMK